LQRVPFYVHHQPEEESIETRGKNVGRVVGLICVATSTCLPIAAPWVRIVAEMLTSEIQLLGRNAASIDDGIEPRERLEIAIIASQVNPGNSFHECGAVSFQVHGP
jgi:hypothetical protein